MKLNSRKKWVAWWITWTLRFWTREILYTKRDASQRASERSVTTDIAYGILNIETGERIVLVDRTEE